MSITLNVLYSEAVKHNERLFDVFIDDLFNFEMKN